MKPIADLAKPIENITEDNVKSSDRDAVVAVKKSAEGVSLTSATPEEKQAVQDILNLCNKLMNKQDETAKAQDPQTARDVQNITPMNVKSTDKNALVTAQKDLETALDTYKNNLTEEEKTTIKNKLNTIEKSLNAIKNAENVQNLIDKLPEEGNIKTSDKAEIEAARKAYDALTDHEKELVQVEKLTKAENALRKMGVSVAGTTNKTDKTSPKTGDESNPALWYVLLILSCIGLNGTLIYYKRRKHSR